MTLSQYFKSKPGFQRLFKKLKEKYISLDRFSGSVKLENISEEEAQTFNQFFNKKYRPHTTVNIKFSDIEKILRQSKYEDFTWEKLFKEYFNETVITKKIQKENLILERKLYLDLIKERLTVDEKIFFENVLSDKELTRMIYLKYQKNKNTLNNDLFWLIKLVCNLDTYIPISLVMLASMTGNPHFLDANTPNYTLFLKLLAFIKKIDEPKTTFEKHNFLKQNGIFIDDISNFVITYKLNSDSNLVNAFEEQNQILNLCLANLIEIKKLDTKIKKVFIFENPSLLSSIKNLNVPIVITYGIPNQCVYTVLEMLNNSGNSLYYNGDFDPEGLIIANKLKEKFPNLILFCYEENDYQDAKSKQDISNIRLSKLNTINNQELNKIKKLLLENKKAGYQENNIDRIKKYINKIVKGEKDVSKRIKKNN